MKAIEAVFEPINMAHVLHPCIAILISSHLLGSCIHARYKRRLFEKYYTMDTSVKRHQQVVGPCPKKINAFGLLMSMHHPGK